MGRRKDSKHKHVGEITKEKVLESLRFKNKTKRITIKRLKNWKYFWQIWQIKGGNCYVKNLHKTKKA